MDLASGCVSKRRYETHDAAWSAAVLAWRHRKVDLRVYFCSGCAGWHLTKQKAERMMRPGWREPKLSARQQAAIDRAARRRSDRK